MESVSLKCSELSSDWQSLLDLTFPDPFVPATQPVTNPTQPVTSCDENQRDINRCNYLAASPSSDSLPSLKDEPVQTQVGVKQSDSGESFYLSERRGDLRSSYDKNTEEYRKRRERNNIAVRRSREKAKQKLMAKEDELKTLIVSNTCLKRRCEVLEEEVKILRSVHEAFGPRLDPIWIEADRHLKALRERGEQLRQEELAASPTNNQKDKSPCV